MAYARPLSKTPGVRIMHLILTQIPHRRLKVRRREEWSGQALLLIHTRLWICLISSPDSGRGATRNGFSKPENRRIILEHRRKFRGQKFRAGWPQGIASLGLPQIRTCTFAHTAPHIMSTLRDGSLSESA